MALSLFYLCVCNAYHICFLRLQRIKYTSNAHSERKEAPCLLIVARAKNDFQLHLHILKMQHFSAKHLESDFKLITHLLHHFPGFFFQTEQLSFFTLTSNYISLTLGEVFPLTLLDVFASEILGTHQLVFLMVTKAHM